MFTKIKVKLNERVVLFKDGLPVRALGPGRHILWGTRYTEQRWNTDALSFKALPEIRAVLPETWFAEVSLGAYERGLLFRDGRAVTYLHAGTRWYWTVDPSVELKRLSMNEPLPKLDEETLKMFPTREVVRSTVQEHERGLRYVKGRLVDALGPGKYTLGSEDGAVRIALIDMRRVQVAITGQELMTRDKVTLRLTLSVEYRIEDPKKLVSTVDHARDTIYLAAQLAARDYVAGVTLDELLEGRDDMTRFLMEAVGPKAKAIGALVESIGAKDIVLPGEMKVLLNRVIEAEKAAAANIILRREEAAATRSMANTAKVMADNPTLMRLKELESLKEIAAEIGEVRLVVGSDGLEKLFPQKLLGE
jgi:regulator of protease activity HflC (stomatin/prohibitin superfamily)